MPNSIQDAEDPETAPLLGSVEGLAESIHATSAQSTLSNAVISRLCVSHFLSAWNSRIFELGSVLFLVPIWPDSLILVSFYALARCAAAILFSPAIGNFIDHGSRLVVVQVSIVGQRIAVAVSCGLLIYMISQPCGDHTSPQFIVPYTFVVLLGGVEKTCHIMNSVSVTRDWVVEMTEGDPPGRAHLNAQIRRIDLSCKLFGPLLIASIDQYSTVVALWFVMGSTLASAFAESLFITTVYKGVSSLQKRSKRPCPQSVSNSEQDDSMSEGYTHTKRGIAVGGCFQNICPWRSLALYSQDPAFLPSLSYAFLQFTVLSFSGRMVAFLLALGYTPLAVGISRTISTIAELSATFLAPVAILQLGLKKAAAVSVMWQTACLTAGVVYFFIGSHLMITGLVTGVILSRVGLWVFDLSIHNIIQDTVESSNRGTFSSAEASVHNAFEMLSYISTIIFSRSEDFTWPMLMTLGSMYLACIVYARFLATTDWYAPLPQSVG